MSRVFFPTTSMNRFGVRDTDQQATLGAMPVQRFPAEPEPHAAMTPTGPMLGGLGISYIVRDGFADGWPRPSFRLPAMPAVPIAALPSQQIALTPPAPPPAAPAAPVSAQAGPTPTVTMPAAPPSGLIFVSSGGGTQTPSTAAAVPAPAAAPAPGFVEGVAAWLGGSTPLFSYNVPNALLAGVVVLGFAWLSSSGKKR